MSPQREQTKEDSSPQIEAPWSRTIDEVASGLDAAPEQGLADQEVTRRRRTHGPNRLQRASSRPGWKILLQQFKSVVVAILTVAMALSFAFGSLPEAFAIFGVILVNTGIGFFSEWRATRSMEALRKMGQPEARVRRDGQQTQIPIAEVVPGDVVVLDAGDVAPADMRLIEANGLRVDESAMTGESEAVSKQTGPVDADAPLADRACMAHKGTTIVEGSGAGLVVATGMDTELGRISQLTEGTEDQDTPLEQRLSRLGRRLAWLVLLAAAGIALAGIWVGQPTRLIIATAIALGVAAVPEGLPIVANLALARGMWLMSRRNALVNRLPAVETLGTADVVFTDKTGTLTENRMTLRKLVTAAGSVEFADEQSREENSDLSTQEMDDLTRRALEIGVLCSNASLSDENDDAAQGDPTEVALLQAGRRAGLNRPELIEDMPELREVSFDADVMMMATFHETADGVLEAVKGAPSAVLDACTRQATGPHRDEPLDDDAREQWTRKVEQFASEGLRLLAVADRTVDDADVEPYEDLRWVGLVGLYDPPREGVDKLVESCHRAGIAVVMVTGDQPQTARAIARQIRIVDADDAPVITGADLPDPEDISQQRREEILRTRIFARFSPEQKLDLVEIYQQAGHVVAMTGDGINDSPALKKADIGVAMGQRGTDAAREASDMVLQDDAFSSIVGAIRQGRVIFDNIRRASLFMICTNIAEVLAVAIASVTGSPLPLLPLQILYLNMLTDALPALALGVGKGDGDIMSRAPRNNGESIMARRHWLAVGGWGLGIAACVLAAMGTEHWWLAGSGSATTVPFLTLGLAKLWFVLNLRRVGSHWLGNTVTRNPWIWAADGLCVVLLVAAIHLPGLSALLKTRPLGWQGWAVAMGFSLVPLAAGQAILAVRGRQSSQTAEQA